MTQTLPTQATGSRGAIMIATETAFGAGGTRTDLVRFKSETLEQEVGIIDVNVISATRAKSTMYALGPTWVSGNIVYPFVPTVGARFLAAALGKDPTPTGAGPYVHTLTPNEDGIPSLVIEKNLGPATGLNTSLVYVGCLVNKFSLKGTVAAEVEATADIIGQTGTVSNTPTTVSPVNETPFALADVAVTIFGTSEPNCSAFELEIANDVQRDPTYSGNRYANLIYSGDRAVTGKLTVRLTGTTYYTNALAGTSGALIINMAQTSPAYSCVITMLNIVYGKPSQPLTIGKQIVQELPFTAYYLPGASYDIQAIVTNGKSGTYV